MDEIFFKRVGEIVSVSVGDKTSGLVVEGISASELFDDGMSSSLTNVMKFVKKFWSEAPKRETSPPEESEERC